MDRITTAAQRQSWDAGYAAGLLNSPIPEDYLEQQPSDLAGCWTTGYAVAWNKAGRPKPMGSGKQSPVAPAQPTAPAAASPPKAPPTEGGRFSLLEVD